jgi:hypothetical protein
MYVCLLCSTLFVLLFLDGLFANEKDKERVRIRVGKEMEFWEAMGKGELLRIYCLKKSIFNKK